MLQRIILASFLSLSLIAPADAGGKSFSSGGRSGSSFSSGGRSSSGGSSYKGRSFSSGTPHQSSTGKKSFSSGQPTTSSDKSKKSFSSGGTSPAPNTTGPPKGKSFSSGDTSKSGKGFSSGDAKSSGNAGERPKGHSIDQKGVQAQQKLQSKENFQKGQAPQQVYRDPKTGTEKKIDSNSQSVKNVRNITHEKYITREHRIETFYGPTYYGRPMVYYSDPFGGFFWWWLLDRSIEERAMWAYCHRSEMDSARYRDLLAKDAQLEARIHQLESQGVRRDTGYVPAGMKDDPDLMYNKEYVQAVYNPTPVPPQPYNGPSAGTFFLWFFIIVMAIVVGWLIIWFVFIRETPD